MFLFLTCFCAHGWRDSNSQPMVLETTTLPIELHPYGHLKWLANLYKQSNINKHISLRRNVLEIQDRQIGYAIISVTWPAPTVLPPSRIAKCKPSSMAISLMSSISKVTLSPGITISTPWGSFTSPVTSVVLK